MSGKDTAGDKLIASIQKTKAQAISDTDAKAGRNDKPAAVATAAKPAATKKAASRKTAANKPVAKKASPSKTDNSKTAATKGSQPAASSGKKQRVDRFQHGRRVWPD